MICPKCKNVCAILKWGLCLKCNREINKDYMNVLIKHADNMRYILDLVCQMTDDRNSDNVRDDSAYQLIERGYLYKVASECREVFRNIANERTDKLS